MKRYSWADSLRGMLIILVVLGHAIQYTLHRGYFDNHLWNYIYSFHMAAFMAVSGFLNYKGKGDNWSLTIKRRFWQLLVPYFLWSVIKVILFHQAEPHSYVNIVLNPDGYFWFLWVLFFISVFFQLGDYLATRLKIKQEMVTFSLCVLFAAIMVLGEIRILGFQFFAYYFLFYCIGYYLHKFPQIVSNHAGILLLLTVVWALLAWFWRMDSMPLLLLGIPLPHALLHYAYRFVTATIAIYVILCVCPLILETNDKWNRPFITAGKISLGIYVIHLLFIKEIIAAVKSCVGNTDIVIIISFAIALGFAWGGVLLLNQWSATKKILLGKI